MRGAMVKMGPDPLLGVEPRRLRSRTCATSAGPIVQLTSAPPSPNNIPPAAMPTPDIAGHRILSPCSPCRVRSVISPSRNRFADPYTDWPGLPMAAAMDENEMNTRRSSPIVCLCSHHALSALAAHTSADPCAAAPPRISPSRITPALCTTPSMRPATRLHSASIASTADSSDTSQRTACTAAPDADDCSHARSSSSPWPSYDTRPDRDTRNMCFAPDRASTLAVTRPSPPRPPVTMYAPDEHVQASAGAPADCASVSGDRFSVADSL